MTFVSFTNTTAGVGNFGQSFEWEFHDSTTTYIKTTSGDISYTDSALSGSGQAGDYNVAINRYFARVSAPLPSPTRVITEAFPITIPSIVNKLLNLLDLRFLIAIPEVSASGSFLFIFF